jgi:hypothetical protein
LEHLWLCIWLKTPNFWPDNCILFITVRFPRQSFQTRNYVGYYIHHNRSTVMISWFPWKGSVQDIKNKTENVQLVGLPECAVSTCVFCTFAFWMLLLDIRKQKRTHHHIMHRHVPYMNYCSIACLSLAIDRRCKNISVVFTTYHSSDDVKHKHSYLQHTIHSLLFTYLFAKETEEICNLIYVFSAIVIAIIIIIPVTILNYTDFLLFIAVFSHKSCSTKGCASATNTVSKDINILRKHVVTISYILR